MDLQQIRVRCNCGSWLATWRSLWTWVFSYILTSFTVDSTIIPDSNIIPQDGEEIQAVTFIGNTGYPSFSMYSHMIRRASGKTYLAFTNAAA